MNYLAREIASYVNTTPELIVANLETINDLRTLRKLVTGKIIKKLVGEKGWYFPEENGEKIKCEFTIGNRLITIERFVLSTKYMNDTVEIIFDFDTLRKIWYGFNPEGNLYGFYEDDYEDYRFRIPIADVKII